MSSIEEVRARMQNKVSAKVGEIKAAQASARGAGVSGGPSVESLPAVSSKETENERQILVTLQEWKEGWTKRIESVTTERELSNITNEGGRNGRWTMSTGPGFIVGRCLEDFLRGYPDVTDEEKSRIRKIAQEMQKEIDPIYLQKHTAIHQAKKAEDEAKAKLVAHVVTPKVVAEAVVLPVVDAGATAATDAIEKQTVLGPRGRTRGENVGKKQAKKTAVSSATEKSAEPKDEKAVEKESDAERRAMAELVEYKENLIRTIETVSSIEDFRSMFPDFTKNAIRREYLDGIFLKYLLTTDQEKDTIRRRVALLMPELYAAYDKREKELKEAVEAVEAEKAEKENMKAPLTAEKTEEEKMSDFVKSIPDGGVIFLVSPAGKVNGHYYRDGDDLIRGKEKKQTGIIDTNKVWEKINKPGWTWKIEALLATADPGEVIDAENEKKIEEELLTRKEQLLDIIRRANSRSELHEGLESTHFSLTGEGFLSLLKKHSFASPERETYFYKEAEKFLRDIGYVYKNKEIELKKAEERRGIEPIEVEEKIKALDAEIAQLKENVAVSRAEYVKEDHRITSLLNRLKNVFGKGVGQDVERSSKNAYLEQLALLKEKELEKLRMQGNVGQDLKKEMEGISRYFKLDESVNLINERTQYKAKNQSFPEKIVNSLGDLGRAYNRIPLKQKLLLTGALAGITIATTLSGGTAIGAMAFISVARRVAAGLGTAVGTEALLESFGGRGRVSKAEKETKEQIDTLKTESLGAKPEVTFDALNAFLDKDIASLDVKLQNEKKAKIWRKVGAAGFGALVGSGWLTRFAMEHLGGHVVVDWAKDHLTTAFGEAHTAVSNVMDQVRSAHPNIAEHQLTPTQILAANELAAPHDSPASIFPESGTEPNVPSVSAEDLNEIAHIAKIDDFVNGDIDVEKGDSVWKIAGGLADKLGLEDAQRTHFIDALKDQYGDVQLKAGETINFSEHGIDKDFVENALAHAKGLTEGQMASIDANDVKIAEFAASHPDVTLTNESVDSILQGNTADVISPQPGISGSGIADLTQSYDGTTEGGTGEVGATPVDTERGSIRSADIQYDRDIILGKTYNLREYVDYFNQHPETFTQFQKIDGDYKKFISLGNVNDFQEMKGETIRNLNNLKETPLGKFIEMSRKTYGAKLGMPSAKEKVYEYVTRMAMLGIEHPKGVIRLPQSI